MKYLTIDDINKEYTKIILNYINKGFTMNVGKSGMFQHEICKSDLVKGDTIIRVNVEEDSEELKGDNVKWWTYYNYIKITVEKFERPNDSRDIWTGKGELLEVYTFYEINSKWHNGKRPKRYTTCIDELARVKNIQREREQLTQKTTYNNKTIAVLFDTDTTLNVAKRYAKKHNRRGYQGYKSKDLLNVEKEINHRGIVQYTIRFYDKTITVCA